MTSFAYTFADSATMLRRNLKHQLRYPSLTLMLAGIPIVFLLLFVYVFEGQLGTRLGGDGAGGRGAYLNYVVPGILIITVASAALGTAISVATDMTGGMIDRFRTMAISRGAVLTGHVIGSLLQTLAVLVLVLGVSLVIGFRSHATALDWLAVAREPRCSRRAHLVAAALGMAAKSVETASTPDVLTLLPFLSSGSVLPPPRRPGCANRGVRALHAGHPNRRGGPTGGPIGTRAIAAIAWSIGIALISDPWAVRPRPTPGATPGYPQGASCPSGLLTWVSGWRGRRSGRTESVSHDQPASAG